MAAADGMAVEVVYCPAPHEVDACTVTLAPGAVVADALQASGVLERHGLSADGLPVGIWCRAASLHAPLRDRDRVEIYRALQVDPKEARRQRYRRQRNR